VRRRGRLEWPLHAQQCCEDGQAEARTQSRASLCVLLHLADPILDGLPGAWHTAELQFCFDNTKRCEQGTGNTPEAQALAKKMASALATFAATGKPSTPGVAWAPTDPETNKTMVWDNQCRMVDDPEGEARKIILS
jgi:para-nitrobenzyl esterase